MSDNFETLAWLEKVVIIGSPKNIKHATITSKSLGTVKLQTKYDGDQRSLIIRKPGVNIREEYTITLH